MAKKFKYDVFLSYSAKDKPAVRELAEKLRNDGVRVWFDEWEIKLGDSIPSKIEEGLEQSRVLILAMSQNAFSSEWVSLERHTARFRDNSQRRFIPLLLEDCVIPDTLRQFAYADWRNRDEEQYQRLLSTVHDASETESSENNNEDRLETEAIRILKGHLGGVKSVAISTDSKLIVSCSEDKTIRIWETETGKCLKVLEGHLDWTYGLAITSDDKLIVSGSNDNTIRIWETETGKCLKVLKGHTDSVYAVTISADNKLIVSGSHDKTIRIWETETGKCLKVFKGHAEFILVVAISVDNKLIISGATDRSIRIWETETGKCLKVLEGHSSMVWGIAITSDRKLIVSSSGDSTVRIWETETGKCLKVLEGHSSYIYRIAISLDDKLIVSGSNDNTIRIWETETGKCLKVLEGHSNEIFGVALSTDNKLIVSGSKDNTIRIWNISSLANSVKQSHSQASKTEDEEYDFYTNAKVLLVGDSGVGKSGLAHRLTQDEFVETSSTDGVWATQMSLPHDVNTEDTEREIWLWDFAGQSDYRLIHQLFMDETSLAVLVFNPQDDKAIEGLGQWDMDLQRAARRPFNKLLVAGRCDRGSLTISQRSLDDFKSEREFKDFLETSAKTGRGCQELREAIIKNINWNDIPYRSSPRIFKLLKEEIIKLKDEGKVLLTLSELKQNLEMRLPEERFTFDEFKTVVGLLAGSGIIWELEFGDFVLLQPERINSYAAAVIRSVRAHVDEIGCILEEKVLAGELDYQDIQRLPEKEEKVVLQAMHQTFVSRGLCLREATDAGVLLVFPSYFRRERPEQDEHPSALVTYKFSGMLDEIYATLVVKLHHTKAFEKDQLWRYAADFKTPRGKRVGLKMTKRAEGAAEITVYFDKEIPDDTKVTFIRYVHDHLQAKDADVKRKRHYVCPNCETPFENEKAIEIRLKKGFKDILCPICENRFDILDLIEEKFASDEFTRRVRLLEERAQISIDNESKELILVGHAFAVAGEAGQIFRPTANSDWGIDGEIEFKGYEEVRDEKGNVKIETKASGKKVYLQLKSGDSYLRTRKRDEKEIFDIKPRHAEYWLAHNYDVMLVIRTSDGDIRWMNATEYLRKHGKDVKQIIFDGEPFVWQSVIKLRDKLIPPPEEVRQ